MLDHLSDLIDRFLVALGLSLSRLSPEDKNMISLLLTFLLLAAGIARVLRLVYS